MRERATARIALTRAYRQWWLWSVQKILQMPLAALLDPATKKTTQMDFRGIPVDVPYYDVDGHIVWGATAAMLSELELRLRHVLA